MDLVGRRSELVRLVSRRSNLTGSKDTSILSHLSVEAMEISLTMVTQPDGGREHVDTNLEGRKVITGGLMPNEA